MRAKVLLLIPLCVVVLCARSQASGFLLYEHNAAAHGMADVRTAIADDPSGVFFNPATLTELPGVQLQLGVMGILPDTEYQPAGRPAVPRLYTSTDEDGNPLQREINDGENATHAKRKGYSPAYGYATWNIFDSGVCAGLGVTSPFGLGIFWPGDWDGRFVVTESDLITILTNPVLAVDLAKLFGFKEHFKLSLAAGYQLLWGEARMSQRIDLRFAEALSGGALQNPWGEMTLTGDGIAHGYNLALYAEWPGQIAVGVSFRSGLTLNLAGTAVFRFNQSGEEARAMVDLRLPEGDRTGGQVRLNLPMQLNTGIAYLGIENLKVGVDLLYSFWEAYDELRIEFECIAEESCSDDLALDPIPADWNNAFQIGVGAEYALFGWIPLRLGYAHITRAVPAETYDPSLPDGARNQFCLGAGLRGEWWKVDLAYAFIFWQGTKDNDVGGWDEMHLTPGGKANGTYLTTTHMLGLSFTAML